MVLNENQRSFLRLVNRSLKGEEWAKVSDTLWRFAQEKQAEMPELVAIDKEGMRVKLTEKGQTVLAYM